MAKLIVTEFLSLDGVTEAPGGEPGYKHSGWVIAGSQDPQQMKYKFDEVMEAERLLIGRVTYESFAGAWPEREGPFADKMNEMPKHVVSSTVDELEWNNSTLVEGDLVNAVTKLKEADGGPILIAGSRTLAQELMKHNLIDEYRLMVFPVVLGRGERLFPDDAADKIPLKLVYTTTFDSGTAVHHYERAD